MIQKFETAKAAAEKANIAAEAARKQAEAKTDEFRPRVFNLR